MVHKVIIIGSGPAGLTAGIYTSRAKLNPILFEGSQPGGQLTTTTKVENWPGIPEVMGFKLMMDMRNHAKVCGCEIISKTVEKVDFSQKPYKIFTKKGEEFLAESIIISTGATHKKLGIPGEQEYWSKGVSVCATCDAPFFKDKKVVIVGGGNTAVQEADYIATFASNVTVVQNTAQLSATDPLKDKVLANQKTQIVYNSIVKEIKGDGQKVISIVIEDVNNKEVREIETDGVFVAIGLKPNTEIFKDQIDVDKWGYIIRKERTLTNKEGIFAAGDVADFRYCQAITASGEGCKAALDCQEYLSKKE